METIRIKNWKLIVVTALISCFIFINEANAQSALGQLQTLAGQNVNTQIPTPNCVCAECGYPCGSGHSSSCPYYNGEVSTTSYNNDRNLTYRKDKANTLNDKGNTSFQNGNYKDAVSLYKRARFFNPFDQTIKQNLAAAQRALDAKKREEALAHVKPKPKPQIPVQVTPNTVDLTQTTKPTPQIIGGNTASNVPLTPSYVPSLGEVKQYGGMYAAQSKLFNTLIDHNIMAADNPYIKVTEGIMNNPSVLVYDTLFQQAEEKKHPQIEYCRKLTVITVGVLPKGINYGLIVGANLVFKNIATYTDIYNGTESREIHEAQVFTVVNALKQSEFDVAMAASTDLLVGNGIKIAGKGILRASEGLALKVNNSFSVIAPNVGREAVNTIMTSGRNVSELVLSKTAEDLSQILGAQKDIDDAKKEFIQSYNQEQK